MMIKLALASLRFRAAAFLATFIAVLLGGSILIACGGLFESAIRLGAEPQRLGGAPIFITGSSGFALPDEESETVAYAERSGVDTGLTATVSAIAGVERALPDVSFPSVIVKNGQPLDQTVLSGHSWQSAALTPYTVRDGTEPAAGQVVLDASLAEHAGAHPGDQIQIAVGGQPQGFVVSGVAVPGHPVDAAAMFFSSVDAQRFSSHPGMVDSIGVFPASGTSVDELVGRLGQQLPPGLSILTGDDRGVAEYPGIESSRLPLILLAAVFGGMVMVVMALVVSATISLSVRQRQQELALLRASGATPAQVHRMVVSETMAVSVLAAIGGIPLGHLMGSWIFALTTDRGVLPAVLEFKQGLIPFAGGALLCLVIPYVAARVAARAAARTRPIQALTEAAIPPVEVGPLRRLLAKIFAAGTVMLAGTTMFLDAETAAAVGGPAVLTGAIAVGLLGPELIGFMVTRLSGVVRRFARSDAELAMINTRSRAVAFATVLTPITLATAIALGNVYSQTTQDDAALAAHLEQLQADVVVTSSTGGIAPALLERVRATPGVATASGLVSSTGWIERPYDSRGSDPLPLLGIDPPDRASVLAVPVTSGSLRDLTGNSVAVPQSSADDLGIKVGDQVTMRLGDGAQVDVKIVALLDSPANFETMVLPADLLARHTTAGLPTQILVRADSGHAGLALLAQISQRVGDWPGTVVGDQDLLTENFARGLGVQAWISYLLALLAIAYAAIAAVNTLAVAVLSRRREFAVQRLAGATRRQVLRMLLVEGAIVAVAGIVLGTVIAAFTVLPTAIAVGSVLPSGPVWVFLAVVAAIFLIVWPVTMVSARLAMRQAPVDAISAP